MKRGFTKISTIFTHSEHMNWLPVIKAKSSSDNNREPRMERFKVPRARNQKETVYAHIHVLLSGTV